jgi:translocator assembly and maintenance protein 41
VVDVDTLKQDLKNWNSLYLSGRLHKPVNTFITSRAVMAYQEKNIESAFNAAILLTSSKAFSVPELLRIICSLSYLGDIRLGFAEDSKKVERIVHGTNCYPAFQRRRTRNIPVILPAVFHLCCVVDYCY